MYPREVAGALGISRGQLFEMRQSGLGPVSINLGGSSIM